MNTSELIDTVRRTGQLSPNDPVYTAAAILEEATQALRDRFAAPIQQTRQGFWLKESSLSTTSGTAFYKIPAKTIVQGLEKVEISSNGTQYHELSILTQPQATPFVGLANGIPTHFTLESDHVRLWPTPDSSTYTVRFVFYLQPPTLMTYEAECRVTSTTATTVVVDTNPASLAIPITTSTGFYVQNYDGTHEIACFDGVVSSITGAGPYTLTGTFTNRERIQVGDYVRPAGYAVFPVLPQELMRPLADYVAGMILVSKGDKEKGGNLSQKAQAGVDRFVEMAVSRVKTRPFVWRRRNSFLRNSWRW